MTDIAADRLSLTLPDPVAAVRRRLRRIRPPKRSVLAFMILAVVGTVQNTVELALGRDLIAWAVPFSYTSTMVGIVAFVQYFAVALRAYRRDEEMFARLGDPLTVSAFATLITSVAMSVAGLP